MEGTVAMTNKVELYPGQRKSSRAVATISKGSGRVRINNTPAELVAPDVARELVLTPLTLVGELRNRVDIDVQVHGGGFMGQAFASAVAISRAMTGQEKGGR
ncbi:MAG: 30S ribosomal protein S9, partial [Nitrososphaera sp.]